MSVLPERPMVTSLLTWPAALLARVLYTAVGCKSSSASCDRMGSPGRAPSSVHLHAATTAASRNVAGSGSPVASPYNTLPMKESPAPVVSATASYIDRWGMRPDGG
ncbi:hypothetical protein Vretimale_10759 [Volvox reticuliferus]|uniref:Secreted protein n=1 Tax=Volvox reticuliferus TaxID=1737510 RepID=A0A8J4CKX7_9CHLO|nr:hypothetical protein Vretifemale_13873 [Volvox reticuliferus]GIM06442.1 hypothetical protein Vretimale_10759 [Volvox reticuliferus]